MKPIGIAVAALLVGALTGCMAYGPGPYDTASAPPQGYDSGYAQASPRAEVGFFYDDLSPYGDWVMTADYGWVWFPRRPAPGWRPYTDGRWVDTAYGWTWVSFEPYGWATYHYGRWAQDPRFGWIWVPGTVWGPAWVSWQYGGGYVGWAPLPPAVGFEAGIGIRLGGFSLTAGIRPEAYCFVPERSFLQPRLSGHMLPRARNVTIIHNTTNITNYTYIDNRVVNRGVELRHIERVTGRPVERFRVGEGTREARTVVKGTEVRFYRPGKQQLDSVHVRPRANEDMRREAPPPARQQPPIRQQVQPQTQQRVQPQTQQRVQPQIRQQVQPQTQQQAQPPTQRRAQPVVPVAPRVERAPHPDARQIEQQDRRQQQELQKYQEEQRKKLEKEHQQELAKARAQGERERAQAQQKADRERADAKQKAERDRAQAQQRAEREAQQEQQRKAQEQLKARQDAARRAIRAKPVAPTKPATRARSAPRATPTPTNKPADPPQRKKPGRK